MTPDLGWRVHITDEFAPNSEIVHIWRDAGADAYEVIVDFDNGNAIMQHIERHVVPPPGIRFPRGAMQAIAEAIKPGPSTGEVKRLEEALAIERLRVDRVLGGLVSP